MFSVENFYWLLFENLLKPVGLDCWYYYPFGTQNNLSRCAEFRSFQPNQAHHVLFHFDQEPLWSEDLGTLYDQWPSVWDRKTLRILANSEYSAVKSDICESRDMADWYYFYHGFASLDWFRDSEFVSECTEISKVFCSFNHLTTGQRAYRMALTARLIDLGLVAQGDISFHNTQQGCCQELHDPTLPLSGKDRHIVAKYLCENHNLPMILDHSQIDGSFSARFGHQEYKLWQQSFLAVVNETVFYDAKLHLTEKVFKPIVCGRPFVLVAAPGNLEYLRSYGFKTFSPWIDESYDYEPDHARRLDMIAAEVAKLCDRPFGEILRMHQDMRSVLDHNKKHFFGEFRRIIVNELVDNFDICVRRWNNGRVDSRDRPNVPDTGTVKQILLR